MSAVSPQQAAAQQAATALEEVIVTARKRAESLQDIPISVTAFTESALKQAGIQTMQDLSDFTPGFDFAQAFGRQDFRPAIRGQSTILGGANAGLFIDGFYIGEGGPTVPYAALERVEVAKGPQSALYGHSTLAGAVNYILKRPTEDYEGVLELGIGEDSEFRTELTFSGPLGNNAGFMVSFSGYQYDGQYTNRYRGFPDATGAQRLDGEGNPFVRGVGENIDVGDEETFSVVGLLEYQISDRMKFTGRVVVEDSDDGPFAIAINPSKYNNCHKGPAYGGSGYYCGEIDVEDILDNDYDNRLNIDTGYFDLGREHEAMRLSGTLEYDLDWAMLTVNAAWHDYDIRNRIDVAYGPVTPNAAGAFLTAGAQARTSFLQDEKEEVSEQEFELRLSSPEDRPLRWVGGLYWYDYEYELDEALATTAPASEAECEGRYDSNTYTGTESGGYASTTCRFQVSGASSSNTTAGADQTRIAAPGAHTPFVEQPGEERTNWAVFAAVEYDLSDALTLGFELRYNEEEVEVSGQNLCPDESNCAGAMLLKTNFSETFDATLYRLTLDYRFNEDLLFYGVIATGNKPGDLNASGTRIPLRRSQIPVDEENSTMYELGLKASAWDGRLQLAASVYNTEWEDQQLTINTTGARGLTTTSFLDNIGESNIRGLEMELQAQITDFWNLRFTYAYTDTEIKEYNVSPAFTNFGSFALANGYEEPFTIFYGGVNDPIELVGCGGDLQEDAQGDPVLDSRGNQVRGASTAANLNTCPVVDISGGSLPQVSKNQLSLSNTFNGVLANGLDWYVRVDMLHRSKRYAQVYNLAHTGESQVIHLRAGLSLDALVEQFTGGRGSLEIALWGRNLTDDQTAPALIRYVERNTAFPRPFFAQDYARAIGFTLPEQRHFGVDLTYRF